MTTASLCVPGAQRVSPITWVGLAIALFAMIVVRHAILHFSPTLTVSAAILNESLTWICIAALCLIIRCGEKLPFSSVGLGTYRWTKSLGWGVVITVAIIAFGSIADLIALLSHCQPNEFGQQILRLPVWLLTVTCLRAGVGEELFYRGYAIERLQALGLSRFWAAALPVLIFSAINCSSRPSPASSLACRAVALARRRVDFIGVVVP